MSRAWQFVTLNDVCKKITDGSHNPPKGIADSEYLMLSSRDIQDDKIIPVGPRYLTKEQFDDENRRTELTPGDVLLTIVGTIGRAAIYSGHPARATLQRSVAVVTPKVELLDARYLMYYFHSSTKYFEDQAQGTAQKGFYLGQLREMLVPLPPLDEQKRIVAKLDQALGYVDELGRATQSSLEELDGLWNSALTEAFNPSISENQGTPVSNEWAKALLGEVAEFVMGQAPPGEASNFNGEGSIFVKAGEFGVLFPEVKEWTTQPLRFAQDGDVLICVVGATVGKLNLGIECAIGRSVAAVRPHPDHLDQMYLYYFLQTRISDVRGDSRGAAQGVISKDYLNNVLIPLPPLDEQKRIVAKLNAIKSELDSLKDIKLATRAEATVMRSSILSAAFTGDL